MRERTRRKLPASATESQLSVGDSLFEFKISRGALARISRTAEFKNEKPNRFAAVPSVNSCIQWNVLDRFGDDRL